MIKKKKSISALIAILIMSAMLILSFYNFGLVGGMCFSRAVTETKYSYVLDDLSTDPNFNASDYYWKVGMDVRVIHIAEGSEGDLFVYVVYSEKGFDVSLKNTFSINISTSKIDDEALRFENYKLEYLNNSDYLYKFKVSGFTLAPNAERYYNISSILHKWDKRFGVSAGNGNIINDIAYKVGQYWVVKDSVNGVTYEMTETEVVTVTSQMIGFRRYTDAFEWSGIKQCDAHYIAFSCDHKIDKLLSADIEYYTQSYKKLEGQDLKLNDDKEKHFVTITSEDRGASKKKNWQRMSSVSEFLDEVEITGNEADTLSQYDWIINFAETEYERDVGGKDIVITMLVPGGFIWSIINACTTSGTVVSEVLLMRLEFETDNQIYNLGVVANRQTGSLIPSNSNSSNTGSDGKFNFWKYIWNCIKHLFQGRATFIETVVAVVVMIAIVALIACFIGFIKWVYKKVFK